MCRRRIMRFSGHDFTALKDHGKAAGEKESQAFVLFSRASGQECEILIANTLVLPDGREMKKQTRAAVETDMKLQTIACGLAYDKGLVFGDAHTHPFQKIPSFSSIDDHNGEKNARGLSKYFDGDITTVMLVFGSDFEHFEGRVWDRSTSAFVKVDRLEILGAPIRILETKAEETVVQHDPYPRHRIIPGWEQGRLGKLKVLVVGLGGNGSLMWMSLLALGVGAGSGWLRSCDHDVLEASNLPRIPYASASDVGKPKAKVAKAYARRKAPNTETVCYQSGIDDLEMQSIAKEANVIIASVDNDGARKTCNQLASRYVVPLVDIATEIIPQEGGHEAIGQVRVVVPGRTGCLMCSDTIDPAEAALDQISDQVRGEHAKLGYVRGTDETPTPSVIHLNGTASNLGISQFLRLVFDEELKGKEFLHYDRQNCQLIAASVPLNKDCPVCGERGYLAAGDERPVIARPDEIAGKNLTVTSNHNSGHEAEKISSQDKSHDGRS